MNTDKEIRSKILIENEKSHDAYAAFHDKAVPYISRTKTREFIWGLIKNALKKNKKEFLKKTVLEVGCGTGTFLNLAKENFAESYHGIDLSGEMINIANNKKPKNFKASFEKCDLSSFSKKHTESYDIILASSFLHHLFDLEEGLIEIKSMLKKDGIFICLHEQISTKEKTLVEKLDEELSFISGNHEYAQFSMIERILKRLSFHTSGNLENFLRLDKYLEKKIRNKIRGKKFDKNKTSSKQINYVDYQLNEEYDLSRTIASRYGDIIPYCYYNFQFFKLFSSENNHHMFVMHKNNQKID